MRLIFTPLFFLLLFLNNSTAQTDCEPSETITELNANQIRAKLLIAGDLWWDTNNGGYFVTNNGSNRESPSALFAGGIWMGGIAPSGRIKLAAKAYGTSSGQTDYYPGPIDQFTGLTNFDNCNQWDRFFEVTSEEIDTHLRLFQNSNYAAANIPTGVKEWPARGNPFFSDIFGFDLPDTPQGLADFWDENEDGIYNPLDGDYPAIFQEGFENPSIPDQMIFWIFNDAGGVHTESNADPMQMEFQVTAFAYNQPNAFDFSTFYKYKTINRSQEPLSDTYFGLWMDPDLGCYTDDYIGCDTLRNMTYLYNADAMDGQSGTTCPGGMVTFEENIPIVGIDFLRTPKDNNGEEIGMSSFIYYNNAAVGNWPAATTDPQTAEEFYANLLGIWRGGGPITFGGSGYQTSGQTVCCVFPSPPDCTNPDECWSMCNAGLGEGDRRTVQSVGPMQIAPGEVNEFIFGLTTTFGAELPCPSLDLLLEDNDLIQSTFDNGLKFQETPTPPNINWVAGNQQLQGQIFNDQFSNNFQEGFEALDIIAPENLPAEDLLYKFEGYKVFQLANQFISNNDLYDPEKARLVYQTDLQNGIGEIFNWNLENGVWVSEAKVKSTDLDTGLSLFFELTTDAFTGDGFENERNYYFAALAYAHNNWQTFDPQTVVGQPSPYLEGIFSTSSATPTIVPPHPNLGNIATITRIDGIGAGQRFLDMEEGMHDKILSANFDGRIDYNGNRAPIEIRVIDSTNLSGNFELTFIDENLDDDNLEGDIRWQLTNLDDPTEVFVSESNAVIYEEFPQYGFAIHTRLGLEPGNNRNEKGDPANGAIGDEYVYENPNATQWFSGIPDEFSVNGVASSDVYNFILGEANQPDFEFDPNERLAKMGSGFFTPYFLTDFRIGDRAIPFITPAWTVQGGLARSIQSLEDLNNVDIVFTSDKSKWSRCVIIESSALHLTENGLQTEGNRAYFDLRGAPSVGKEDANGDGFPDPDGDGEGMGWFPGYAIDVETGERLNIFFGEASIYRCTEPFFNDSDACNSSVFKNNSPTGADMMWNPTDQIRLENIPPNTEGIWEFITGGQHFIYVTSQPYDGCVELRGQFEPGQNPLLKARAFRDITWAGIPILEEGTQLNSYEEGLIPNDLTAKLRVDNPFQVEIGTGDKNGYPTYIFNATETISGLSEIEDRSPLDEVKLFPNPISGTDYRQLVISDLPTNSQIHIFNINGELAADLGVNRDSYTIWQPKRDLEPGMYFVRVTHPIFGIKMLKWLCVN